MHGAQKLDLALKAEFEMAEISHESFAETKYMKDHHESYENPTDYESADKFTFDTVLNRVGFGRYHYKLFVILGLLGMADGSESMVISFIVPIFKKEFQPSYDLESYLGTSVYIGYFIGSLLSGYFSDKYGRKRPVVYSNLLMIILGLISAYPPNLVSFIILRGLFGIIVGFFSPLAYTIMAEITPVKYRGKYMVLLGIFYTLGEIVSCLIAIFTLDTLKSGNWHGLLAWSTFPALLAWIASLVLLDESARHEMILGNYENGVRVLNKMYAENQNTNHDVMTEEEKEKLIYNYKNKVEEGQEEEEEVPIKELFKGVNRKITPFVWINWFANSLTFFGLVFLLPTTLSELKGNTTESEGDGDDDGVSSVIYSSLSALPTVFVAAALVDLKHFGRKNSLFLTFFLGGITCLLAYVQLFPGFVFWISITKFFFSLAFTLNFQFTSELYPTKIRGTGIGMASAFGRIGSIIMPSTVSFLSKLGILIPYLMYGVGSLFASFATTLLPYDTAGLEMSSLDRK